MCGSKKGAPAHAANKVQKFCQNNMANFWSKDFWPPSSPDLNHLDFSWWGAIEKKTNATFYANVDLLKAAFSREFGRLIPRGRHKKGLYLFQRSDWGLHQGWGRTHRVGLYWKVWISVFHVEISNNKYVMANESFIFLIGQICFPTPCIFKKNVLLLMQITLMFY